MGLAAAGNGMGALGGQALTAVQALYPVLHQFTSIKTPPTTNQRRLNTLTESRPECPCDLSPNRGPDYTQPDL